MSRPEQKRKWAVYLWLIAVCLWAGVTSARAADHSKDPQPTFSLLSSYRPTLENPYFEFDVKVCNVDGNNDGWVGSPSLYVGESLVVDLGDVWSAIKDAYSNGNESTILAEVKKTGKLNTASKTFFTDESTHYFSGEVYVYNARRSGNDVFVTIGLFMSYQLVDHPYIMHLKGKWAWANNSSESQDFDLTVDIGSVKVDFPSSPGTYQRIGSKVAVYKSTTFDTKTVTKTSPSFSTVWHYRTIIPKRDETTKTNPRYNGWPIIAVASSKNTNYQTLDNAKYYDVTEGMSYVNLKFSLSSNYEPQTIYPYLYRRSDDFKITSPDNTTSTMGTKSINFGKWYDPVVLYGYPRAASVKGTFEPWEKKITLQWSKEIHTEGKVNEKGKWVIFGGTTSSCPDKIGEVAYNVTSFEHKRSDAVYGNTYYYRVVFQPDEWETPLSAYTDAEDLSAAVSVYAKRSSTNDVLTTLTVNPNDEDTKLVVSWSFKSYLDASSSHPYEIKLFRRLKTQTSYPTTPIYKQTVNSSSLTSGAYEDPVTIKTLYYYKLVVEAQDTTFSRELTTAVSLNKQSNVTKLTASRGEYSGSVHLNWEAKQVGEASTYYEIYRRLLGSDVESDYRLLSRVEGTASSYSYDDKEVKPGSYYDYKVACYNLVNGEKTWGASQTTDGFALATGLINGRITFGSGTAVDGVKVSLSPNADGAESQFRSVAFSAPANKEGIRWDAELEQLKSIFGGDWTFQCFVQPSDEMNATGTAYILMNVYNTAEVRLLPAEGGYKVGVSLCQSSSASTSFSSDFVIPTNKWSHITISNAADSVRFMAFYQNGQEITQKYSRTAAAKTRWMSSDATNNRSIVIGNSADLEVGENHQKVGGSDYGYAGNLDEVRIFSRALTQKEVQRNYNHRLAGTEDKLALYYTFDECINGQTIAYDYSRTSGIANGRHGSLIGCLINDPAFIPSENLYSICGFTDANGNYTVSGIPFSGEGTSYSVTPTLGIHKFSPTSANRFISAQSLIHNGVDFEDVSSFPVSGVVYYEGTSYPVEGVTFTVDGTACVRDNQRVETDANGEFTIDVPIGDHYITAEKNGHTFLNEGRYPADPQGLKLRRNYNQAMTGLTFTDVTKVVICGRVSGGEVENGKIMTCPEDKSVNNIGMATIQLSVNDKYSLNVVRDEKTNAMKVNTASVSYASPTTSVMSRATVGCYDTKTKIDRSNTITIRTDSLTGEWAALVPPILYKVESCTTKDFTESDFEKFTMQIDATNASRLTRDSINISKDTVPEYILGEYEYAGAALKICRINPTEFSMSDCSNEVGAFGDSIYVANAYREDEKRISLYHIEDGVVKYTYDYPIFTQAKWYAFNISAFQTYVNEDSGSPIVNKLPMAGLECVFENQFGANNEVDAETGEITKQAQKKVTLDSLGCGVYQFMAGLPNIKADDHFARNLNITYGKKSVFGNNPFKGIIFGALQTGSNFVTSGPDKVAMILRDPPGSNSYAYMEKGTEVTHTETNLGTAKGDVTTGLTVNFGAKCGTAVGGGVAFVISEQEMYDQLTVEFMADYEGEYGPNTSQTNTSTMRIQTQSNASFVGSMGDIFIGTSTNLLFGLNNEVAPHLTDNGQYELSLKEMMSVGQNFTTDFQYSQYYIENELLPNLKKLRNSLIQPMGTNISYPDRYAYVSTVPAGDPAFGDSAAYTAIYPTNENAIAIDSVSLLNTSIKNWIKQLSDNERAKLEAIGNPGKWKIKNLSFDGGAIYEAADADAHGEGWSVDNNVSIGVHIGNKWGAAICGTGSTINLDSHASGGYHRTTTNDSIVTNTYGYHLEDENEDDAFTVDVYNAPDGFGPIFVTRGGKSSAPYEGQIVTKYYEPGTEISSATMQIEVPKINVDVPTQLNVPTGKAAQFVVALQNNSETNSDAVYSLELCDANNLHGAKVEVNGTSIASKGYQVIVRADETLRLNLTLRQTDESILDYENIGIRLASLSQNDDLGTFPCIADTAYITAKFVAACTDITLQASEPVINMLSDPAVVLTISDYDINHSSLRGVMLRYRREGDPDWTNFREYVLDPTKVDNVSRFQLTGAPMSYRLDMSNVNSYPDGEYQFQAVSMCDFGDGTQPTCESAAAHVVKDVARPQLIALPSPSNGILTADGEVSVLFNEDIRSSQLTKVGNFSVRGKLNDAQVAHDGVLALQGTEAARTKAILDLSQRDFSLGLWFNYAEPGDLFTHGAADNKLIVSLDATGHLVIKVGNESCTSTSTIPSNKWGYLMFSYIQENEGGTIYARVAFDDQTINLVTAKEIATYTGNGQLALGGNGYTGSIHEVSLWNTDRTMDEAQADMYRTKVPSTKGLIGYWRLDEGHGAEGTDYVRSRHMTLPSANAWHMENANYAIQLDGSQQVGLDVSAAVTGVDDNYMLETWVKAAKVQTNSVASIFQFGQNDLDLRIKNGVLELATESTWSQPTVIGNQLSDGEWHHVALNVQKATSGSAVLYIDGKSVKQFSAAQFPAVAVSRIFVGSQLTGAIDEVRYWKGSLSRDLIVENMYQRIDGENAALAAYYPFEEKGYDEGNQLIWSGSMKNQALKAQVRPDAEFYEGAAVDNSKASYSTTAPALKSAPLMQSVDFNFVTNERKVLINLSADADRIEGTTLEFTLSNVRDVQNNPAAPITWTAYIQRNQLKWADDEVEVTKENVTTAQFTAEIQNLSGQAESWVISNLPLWLSVDAESGTLQPLASRKLRFTVDAGAAIGQHEAVIYLTGSLGINDPLVVNLTCKGEVPAWTVNPADYEFTMNVNGQLSIEGITSLDKNDLVAAFRGTECVGVAQPTYYARYDSYYLMMSVYGNTEDEGTALTYKVYDASTGKTYAMAEVSKPEAKTFTADEYVGTMNDPNLWTTTDKIEQNFEFKKGWQWISFAVNPDKAATSELLEGLNAKKLVGENASWSALVSSLSTVSPGTMYKLQMAADAQLCVIGTPVNLATTQLTIHPNWNWIGYFGSDYISLAEAFAELSPAEGDIVKSQNAFAMWTDYEWVGTLAALQIGSGYQYLSQASSDRQFHYPAVSSSARQGQLRAVSQHTDDEAQQEIALQYQSNMNLIATVVSDGARQEARLKVLDASGNLRGVSTQQVADKLHFVTIAGQTADEALHLVVEVNGIDYLVPGSLFYRSDIVVGSVAEPLVIDLQSPMGIGTIHTDANQGGFRFDVQGRPVNADAHRQLIIDHGKKMIYE